MIDTVLGYLFSKISDFRLTTFVWSAPERVLQRSEMKIGACVDHDQACKWMMLNVEGSMIFPHRERELWLPVCSAYANCFFLCFRIGFCNRAIELIVVDDPRYRMVVWLVETVGFFDAPKSAILEYQY
jgi:hypothetical protein